MDDLHPDQLYNNLPIFSELSGLRQRLKTPSTFAKAAKEVQAWAGVKDSRPPRPSAAQRSDSCQWQVERLRAAGRRADRAGKGRGVDCRACSNRWSVRTSCRRRIRGRTSWLRQSIRRWRRRCARCCIIRIFSPSKRLWRSVDMLVRRLETDEHLQIVLYDVTAEEIAADLSKADALENSGLYKLLVEQPRYGCGARTVCGRHRQLPFRADAAACGIAGAHRERSWRRRRRHSLRASARVVSTTKPADLHPLIRKSGMRWPKCPRLRYLGLVVPRFMLRNPYGERTDPIESFDFEEFTPQAGSERNAVGKFGSHRRPVAWCDVQPAGRTK